MLWLYQIFIWITWQGALCSQPSGRRTVQIPTMDDCRRQAQNEDEHREVEDKKEASVLMRNFDFIYLEYFTGNVVALLLAISLSLVLHTSTQTHTHTQTHARTHAHTHTYNRHLCLSLRVVLTNQLCPVLLWPRHAPSAWPCSDLCQRRCGLRPLPAPPAPVMAESPIKITRIK